MDDRQDQSLSVKARALKALNSKTPNWLAACLKRLSRDFKLSLLTIMGLLAFIVLTPFAIYRASQGLYGVVLIDLLLISMAAGIVIYAWRTGDTYKPGLLYALTLVVCCPLIIAPLGENAFLWSYAVILGIFFLTPPKQALALNIAMILCTGLIGYWSQALDGGLPKLMVYYASTFTTAMLTLIFALHTHSHTQVFIRQATRDPLTGAGNRRALSTALAFAQTHQNRHQQQYGILMLDLDHFKLVNDRFGHAVGDQVLIEFVQRINHSARKLDTLYRIGGEEFLLLASLTHPEGLQTLALKLLEVTGKNPFQGAGHVSLSIGGTVLKANQSWQEQIEIADQYLYQAKTRGRARAIIDGVELITPA